LITLSGTGAIIKNSDNHVFMIQIRRRGMVRWELPTRVLRKGESIFLALYRCIEEESSSQIAVRIGRPICLGLNRSSLLGYQYFAMFFECTAEICNIKLTEHTDIKLPEESRQEILGASFIDWQKLNPKEVHPQHQKILSRWQQTPDAPLFAVSSDADSELAFYNEAGSPIFLILDPLETSANKKNSNSRNEDDLDKGDVKLEVTAEKNLFKILFLSSEPNDTIRLRLGEELREIQEKLQLAKLRDRFELYQRMSVRPTDITQALLDTQPRIVHFSGHGTSTGALCFEDQIGKTHPIQADALSALFEQFSSQVNCVLLNACYAENQAKAISQHIDYVIGMNQAISDRAAIAFTIGFYQALGAGKTIEEAYKLGCVQIRLQEISGHLTPVLIRKGQA
jgi:CHAT domain